MIICIYAEVGYQIHWTKDFEDGAVRQDEKRMTTEKIRHAEGCVTEEDARVRVI